MPIWFGWLTFSNQTVERSADSRTPSLCAGKHHSPDFQSTSSTIYSRPVGTCYRAPAVPLDSYAAIVGGHGLFDAIELSHCSALGNSLFIGLHGYGAHSAAGSEMER